MRKSFFILSLALLTGTAFLPTSSWAMDSEQEGSRSVAIVPAAAASLAEEDPMASLSRLFTQTLGAQEQEFSEKIAELRRGSDEQVSLLQQQLAGQALALNTVSGRATALEEQLAGQTGALGVASESVTQLTAQLAQSDETVAVLTQRLGETQSTLTKESGKVAALTAQFALSDEKVTTLAGQLSGMQTALMGESAKVAQLTAQLASLEAAFEERIAGLIKRLTPLEEALRLSQEKAAAEANARAMAAAKEEARAIAAAQEKAVAEKASAARQAALAIRGALECPEIHDAYLSGVLVFRPTVGSDVGKIEFPVSELKDPFNESFNLSSCVSAVPDAKYLRITMGYRRSPEHDSKYEVWITPHFWVNKNHQDADHLIQVPWKAPIGVFYTASNWSGWYDYFYITTQDYKMLSSTTLHDHSSSAPYYSKNGGKPSLLNEREARGLEAAKHFTFVIRDS